MKDSGPADWGVVIAVFAAVVFCIYQGSKPEIYPQVTGRIQHNMFMDNSLEIGAWHQNAGTLKNGILTITITPDAATSPEKVVTKQYSFDSWLPNQDQAVSFSFPLPNYDPAREIPVKIELKSSTSHPTTWNTVWTENGWKK